jgi:hypothetical protein
MSSTDVATNQNQISDQKSDINKQQDPAGSGTDDPKQINGKNVIGKSILLGFFLMYFQRKRTQYKTTMLLKIVVK